jgi:hypothetical protein
VKITVTMAIVGNIFHMIMQGQEHIGQSLEEEKNE